MIASKLGMEALSIGTLSSTDPCWPCAWCHNFSGFILTSLAFSLALLCVYVTSIYVKTPYNSGSNPLIRHLNLPSKTSSTLYLLSRCKGIPMKHSSNTVFSKAISTSPEPRVSKVQLLKIQLTFTIMEIIKIISSHKLHSNGQAFMMLEITLYTPRGKK